jgi:hypothetical protein
MILTNKIYDGLKWVALVFLPALAVFYLALAQSWNLPYPTEIAATIAAIDVFLAALLGVSTSNYKVRAASLGFDLSSVFGTPESGWILNKTAYDILSWVAQILLPALSALYYALAGVWHLPNADEVVSTLMALDTFLGMILGFSTSQFHKQVAIDCFDHPAGMSGVIKK